MKYEAITFDCAGTLLDVKWDPARLAVTCARDLGHDLDEGDAIATYERLVAGSRRQYCEVNRQRDFAAVDDFWRELTYRWGDHVGLTSADADAIRQQATRRLFEPNGGLMRLYDDVIPTLTALRGKGLKLAVVSNWDLSLYRALDAHGLSHFFDAVVPSLEIGHEKPDPEIFRIATEHLGVPADRTAHVGDDPLDDLQGARMFGMAAVLLNRGARDPRPPIIASLLDLEDALA